MTKNTPSDELYKKAKIDFDLKKYQKSINESKLALKESPNDMDIQLLLGKGYFWAHKYDSARETFSYIIKKEPKNKDAYLNLINVEINECNYNQALDYCDEELKYYPNDKDVLKLKLTIYNKEGNWNESNKMAEYIFDHYSNDPDIRARYIEHKIALARHYQKNGFIDLALKNYESVLEQEPQNKDAMESIYNLDLKSGDYSKSLISINRALLTNPNNFEFLTKKLIILCAMSMWTQAIEVVEQLAKLYPGNKDVRSMDINTRMDAGRYFMKQDPLLQFVTVLDKDPLNKDALSYVINISYSRGLLPEAIFYINKALKLAPNDKELLAKKQGILEVMENYGQASIIAEILYRQNPTPAGKEHLIELKNTGAKNYLIDQEYDSAVVILNSVLALDHNNLQAINYLITAYSNQKKYDEAIHVIDDALKTYPDNESLLFKKAGLLESYQRHLEAAKISKKLIEKHPKNKNYIYAYVDQMLAAGKQTMQYEDYISSLGVFKTALLMQPENMDALNYVINLELALKQYDTALHYCNQAIKYYPDSKEFLFKKSIVYAEAKQYKQAYAISGDLYSNYPYNSRFKGAYVDQLIASGKQYMNNYRPDSALREYYKALVIAPTDTTALFYTINLLNDRKQFDSALVLIEKGRHMYQGHYYFLLKRAVVLESRKKYLAAWKAMDTLSKMMPLEQKYIDYKEFLYAKTLRNELGVAYLNSTYDPQTILGDFTVRRMATLQYTHKFDNSSLTGVVYYAGRLSGSGVQFEGQGTLNHTSRTNSWVMAAFSKDNNIFPPFRGGYSLFHSFKFGLDADIGIRYTSLDSDKTYSYGIGAAREWRDFYFSARYFMTELTHFGAFIGPFSSGVFSTRYYVNEPRTNFFSMVVGYGLAPDDISRANEANYKVIQYKTISVGAGYNFQLRYRTSVSVSYAWYNIQYHTSPDTYRNQYDLFLSIFHKF